YCARGSGYAWFAY
nr:immunoglobulin heavy chain junction region [Mus musculus]